jgi:hypothetical protein
MNTVSAMKPNFITREDYLGWRQLWKTVYARLSGDIQQAKLALKAAQRSNDTDAGKKAKALHYNRRVAFKMMTLLQDAMVRRDRILSMHKEIAEQPFPLDLGECKSIDFHYNRGANDFPFLPTWVIRAKGRSYYVREVEFSAPCTTKERATGSTKGVLRFKRCSVEIDADGNARIGDISATKALPDDYSESTA